MFILNESAKQKDTTEKKKQKKYIMMVIIRNKKKFQLRAPCVLFRERPRHNGEFHFSFLSFLSFFGCFFFVVVYFTKQSHPHRNKQTQFTSPLGSQQHEQVHQ